MVWKNIITFGAAGRVEDAANRYNEVLDNAKALEGRIEARRQQVKTAMDELVELKRDCVRDLAKVRNVSKHLGAKERLFLAEVVAEEPPAVAVAGIEHTLNGAQIALGAAKGAATGVSTAAAAWALAGAYGAASTGTALTALSGVAAEAATLAWFGGGSVAAGGMGVAGGTAVLGGIVAVPALAVMAVLAHSRASKDIARYEQEMANLEKAMDDMLKLLLVIDIAEQRTNELLLVTAKARTAYLQEYALVLKQLYPLGWFSRAWRWLRKLFGRSYFTASDARYVQFFLQGAAAFAKILDQRVINTNGSVEGSSS